MIGAPTVAIIGRPNVGKSTLFNRLIGRRQAIVDDRPGVTRDRHFAVADWNGRRFWLVDTGGLVPRATDALNRAVYAGLLDANEHLPSTTVVNGKLALRPCFVGARTTFGYADGLVDEVLRLGAQIAAGSARRAVP